MPKPNKLAKPPVGPPTQSILDISEVRDNCVVMKDGSLRAVLLCSSINFSLKSDDEQAATIQAYVQFLNSIDFTLQIVIQSRRLNIDGYLARLRALEKQQTNELLQVQIADYLGYITELISLGEIMTKRFYVVVPYSPGEDAKRSWFRRVLSVFRAASSVKLSRADFDSFAETLDRRTGYVTSGLASMGLSVVRLDTQSLIELYYATYNPDLKEQQPLASLDKLQVEPLVALAEAAADKK